MEKVIPLISPGVMIEPHLWIITLHMFHSEGRGSLHSWGHVDSVTAT